MEYPHLNKHSQFNTHHFQHKFLFYSLFNFRNLEIKWKLIVSQKNLI